MPLRIDACAAQHQGDRAEQQDRVSIFQHPKHKHFAMAVVADGMGGHTGGALAAEQVIHTSKALFDNYVPKEESIENLLTEGAMEAHTLINTMRFLNEKDPHSTMVAFFTDSRCAWWAHCGDSRLYRFRGKRFISHTADHSLVNQWLDEGKISPKQAINHPQRHVVVTAVGGEPLPRVDVVGPKRLISGDCFLLCSDGLWAYCTPAGLAEIVSAESAREACAKLIDTARERAKGQGDNISIAILKFLD